MKNTGKCPKCAAGDLIRIPGGGSGDAHDHILRGMTVFSMTPVTRFVCGKCGFSEEWIDSDRDIEKLRKKFSS